MWNDGWSQEGMTGWSDWLFSFHGILTIVSLAIIVIVGIALFRDWRREPMDEPNLAATEREKLRRH